MKTAVVGAALAVWVAACLPALPYADCGEATAGECRLVVEMALTLLPSEPDRLLVGGTGPVFVVIGCYPEGAVPVDAIIGADSSVEARLRDSGPNLAHLCLANAPPP